LLKETESMGRRAAKISALLTSLEAYLNEVVTSNHDMKHEQIIRNVRDNFRRSVQANIDYHGEMSRLDETDTASSSYHKLMADVYKSLLA